MSEIELLISGPNQDTLAGLFDSNLLSVVSRTIAQIEPDKKTRLRVVGTSTLTSDVQYIIDAHPNEIQFYVIDKIKDMSASEMKDFFGVTGPISPEAEARIRKENPWLEN